MVLARRRRGEAVAGRGRGIDELLDARLRARIRARARCPGRWSSCTRSAARSRARCRRCRRSGRRSRAPAKIGESGLELRGCRCQSQRDDRDCPCDARDCLRWPPTRLSMTRTAKPRASSSIDHVAADEAGAAGDDRNGLPRSCRLELLQRADVVVAVVVDAVGQLACRGTRWHSRAPRPRWCACGWKPSTRLILSELMW